MTQLKRKNGELIADGDYPIRELAERNKTNLWGADLGDANLRGANLWGANLRNANLRGADLSFSRFPSIRLLSSIPLGRLNNKLTIELMHRDANGHPKPELFDAWAVGGKCPYENEERLWDFEENRDIWKPGLPEMMDRDLIMELCKEKGWGIKGYLKCS